MAENDKDIGVKATRRVRALELHHAVASLERAVQLLDDPLKHDIENVLSNARDLLELSIIQTDGR